MGISSSSSIIMVITLAGVVIGVPCLPVHCVPLQHLLGEADILPMNRAAIKMMILYFMLVVFKS